MKQPYITILTLLCLLTNILYAQDVTLMNYNIGSANWVGNRDSVRARVKANNPDVFCAIEATANKRPYVESSLNDYSLVQTFGSTPNLCESHIFYRSSMFIVVDSGYTQMDTYGGYTGIKRYVNWARLEENTSKKQFIVYASHFVFVQPANPDSATLGQYRHAWGMVNTMQQHASLNIPMITVGDFNADSSKDVMQFLLHQKALTDNGKQLTNPLVLKDSWYIANPNTKKSGTVGSGFLAIDWILTTPNTNVTTATIDNGGKNTNGDYPSDHLPLVINFNLSENATVPLVHNQNTIQLYPNPFRDYIQLKLQPSITNNATFTLTDATGQAVMSIGLTNGMQKIDCSAIASGTYFYKIRIGHKNYIGCVLKKQ